MNKQALIQIIIMVVLLALVVCGVSSCCAKAAWNVVSTEIVEVVIEKVDFAQTYNKNFGTKNTYIFAVKWDGGATVIEVSEELYVTHSPGDTVKISITHYNNGFGATREVIECLS